MSMHKGNRGKSDNLYAQGNNSVDWLPRTLSRGRSRNGDRSVGPISRKRWNKSCERSTESLSKAFYDDIDLSYRGGSSSSSGGRSSSSSRSSIPGEPLQQTAALLIACPEVKVEVYAEAENEV
ncbi:hypothetical protein HJC23_008291 [Cyclotella cryptica]|uniref:Uncharacterized protein n=1 Tax=Cyclotella cryptica TaxID=29204 RepID=A0ABD3PDX7_9STRA